MLAGKDFPTPKRLIMCSLSLLVVSCANVNQVAKPTDVTVREAVVQLADAIYEAQQRARGRPKAGLIVDEAVVEFNIAAKASNTTTSGASAKGIPLDPGGALDLSITNQAFSEGSRANTIKITFKNIATADYSKGGLKITDRCFRNPQPPDCPPIILDQKNDR